MLSGTHPSLLRSPPLFFDAGDLCWCWCWLHEIPRCDISEPLTLGANKLSASNPIKGQVLRVLLSKRLQELPLNTNTVCFHNKTDRLVFDHDS